MCLFVIMLKNIHYLFEKKTKMRKFFGYVTSFPSLRKKYYTIFILISLVVLTTIATYITYSYQNFQKKLYYNLETSAQSIMEELERDFDDNEALLKYLGEIIAKTQSYQDLNRLSKVLTSTGEFNIRSLATSYVSWATEEGMIIVSGKKGILHDNKQSILTRRYFETARKTPWKIQFSKVTQSLFSTSTVLPTAMGIQDKSGEFLGYLVLGLRLKLLTEQLKKFTSNAACYFVVLDQHLGLAIASSDILKKDFYQNQSLLKKKILTGTFTPHTFSESGIKFVVLKKFDRYPFYILTGYSSYKASRDLLKKLLPSILEFIIMSLIALLLLNLFKKKIIFPINKLYDSCLQLSQGNKAIDFPHFNIQELDKLSEGLKLLSVVFAAYESQKKKLEEIDKIANLSDNAKQKHLDIVYHTFTQYLSEIRLCILGLRELSSLNVQDHAVQLLEALDKKSDDILNSVFADDEKTFFDIYALLQECQIIYLKEAHKGLITIEIHGTHPLPPYYGDQLKMKQILLSLIGKCFKSVPEGGHIQITTATFIYEQETFIEITITDDGFSEETILHIERTLEIDKKFQLIGLSILSVEKVQDLLQEEGGVLDIVSYSKGRKYVLTLSTTYLNLPEQKKSRQNNIIPFSRNHNLRASMTKVGEQD